MRIPIAVLLLPVTCYAETIVFGEGGNAFEIEFVEIGDPGNPMDDPFARVFFPGRVDYVFEIGMYEVSREIVTKATNAGALQIDMHAMDEIDHGPRPQMPATGITWLEVARFVNWLNTRSSSQSARSGDLGGERCRLSFRRR